MAVETLELRIQVTGASAAKADIAAIGGASKEAAAGLSSISEASKAAFSGLGTGIREATTAMRATMTQVQSVGEAVKSLATASTTARASLEGFGRGFSTVAEFARASQKELQSVGRQMIVMADSTRLVSEETNRLLIQLGKANTYWGGLGTGMRVAGEAARATATDINRVTAAVEKMQLARMSAATAGGGVPGGALGAGPSAYLAMEAAAMAEGTAGVGGMKNLGVLAQLDANRAAAYASLEGNKDYFGYGSFSKVNTGAMAVRSIRQQNGWGASPAGGAVQEIAAVTPQLKEAEGAVSKFGKEAEVATTKVKGMNDALRFMRSALVLLSFARVFEGLAETLNDFQTMQNKLRLVTNSTQEARDAQITLAKAAVETRASYGDTVDVFAGLARSTKSLNLDYGQLLTLTKEWNQSIVVSGVDQQQARNAMKDFVEELNLGVIQGRQLRALLMQNPEFLRLMAEGMVKVGKASDPWFAKVREATAGGKTLSGTAVFDLVKQFPGAISSMTALRAVMLGADEEAKKFGYTTTTIGQSFTNLKTKAEVFFALLTEKTGALAWLQQAIGWIGDHLDSITMAVAAFAGLLVINFVTGAIATFGTGSVKVFETLTSSVKNLTMALRGMIGFFMSDVGFPMLIIGGLIYALFHDQINAAIKSAADQAQAMGGPLNYIIALVATAGAMFETAFGHTGLLFRAIGDDIITMVNIVTVQIERLLNWMIDQANKINPFANIPHATGTGFQNPFAGASGEYQKTLEATATANFTKFMQMKKSGQDFFAQFKLENLAGLDLTKKPPGAGTEAVLGDKVATSADAFARALDRLEAILDKFDGPMGKYNKSLEDVNKTLTEITTAHGKVPAAMTEAQVAMVYMSHGFTDLNVSLDQYGHKIFTSEQYNGLLRRSALGLGDALRNEGETYALINLALEKNNISMEESIRLKNQATIAALGEDHSSIANGIEIAVRKSNAALLDRNSISEAVVSDVLKEQDAIAKLGVQYEALRNAEAQGIITSEDMADKMRYLQIAALSFSHDMSDGFVRGMLEVQKSMNDVAGTAAEALKNSFKSLEDTLVEFFDTGKLNVQSFAKEVLTQFTRLAVQGAIMQPLANFLGFGNGQTSGGSIATSGLSKLFGGGSGALPGGGLFGSGSITLGADSSNPMFVQVVGMGTIPGLFPAANDNGIVGAADSLSAGSPGLAAMSLAGAGASMARGGGGGSSIGLLAQLAGASTSAVNWADLMVGGPGLGGGGAGFLSDLASYAGSFVGFAEGTDFMVGGNPGVDNNLVAFRASSDERVSVQTPAQQRSAARAANSNGRSAGDMHLHLHGVQDADSFKRSRGQVASGMGVLAEHMRRRNA